jgi:hypothetical protein
MKGFSEKWCHWINQVVTKGSVAIKVNEEIGRYFQTKKGLRQGDPLSPLLFNLVADMLTLLISRAKEDGQINGLIPHLVQDGISILQYADDTILFMDHNIEQAINLKLVLCVFEQLSGLKINFHKSELFCYGEAKEYQDQYAELFGCGMGKYPFKYLGILMHHKKLLNVDWKSVEKKFEKRLSCWKGKMLSYGGRLILVNSVLSSLTLFMLSFYEIPKGILHKLDFYRSRLFWQGDNHKKKYRLTKWNIICRPKDQGGLGILDLGKQNTSLLSKWLFRLINGDGARQKLLRNKYLREKSITQVHKKSGDSQFWTGLMSTKDQFLRLGNFRLQSGNQTRFWEDKWIGANSFQV